MGLAIKYFIFVSIEIIILIKALSANIESIKLDYININEELEPNYLILNFTDLLINRLNVIKKSSNLIRLESIRFDQSETDYLNEYFSIDLKKFGLQDFDEVTQNQSTIILLKTSSKKLDREYLCRLDIPNCQCESDCFLNLNLIAYFLDTFDKEVFELSLNLPILLNDLNDNKPFFYQPDITIDLDQIDFMGKQSVKIPLKLAADLDSTKINQVLGYELEKVSFITDNYASISYKNDQLDMNIDLSKINTNLDNLNDKFRLAAMDNKYKVYQTILIKYKIPKLKAQVIKKLDTPSPRVNQQHQQQNQNLISVISALNDIEVQQSNSSDSYEIKFKSDLKNQIFVSNKTDPLITLAYFIVEKNKLSKKSDVIELNVDQSIDSQSLNNEYTNELFRINEMRNGLYAISVKSYQYDKIVKSINSKNDIKVNYKLNLKTKINNLEILKSILIKIPVNILLKNKVETSTFKPLSVNSIFNIDSTDNLNIHNYLVIVSIACAVLVIFAIVCVCISVMCYCCNKCKKSENKKIEKNLNPIDMRKNNTNIMVYDVLPNGQKSLSSSSSSSCASSNLSPVTTTTTSVLNEHILHETKPTNPLFDTHLNNEWYQSQNQTQNSTPSASSPMSSSSSCNLIKPVDEVDKYKNDLYRNSQVMYKQKQLFQQNQSNYYSLGANVDKSNKSEIYQAKPINVSLLNNSIGSSTSPSYSFINDLNSMDNLKDSIKDKMMSRLNEALATNNNSNMSTNSFGQISCV